MPSFQEQFPEHRATAPTLVGETAFPRGLKVPLLRRQQLVDLAQAYKIPINPEATKSQILPHMVAAEQQGRFLQPALDQEALQKALLNPDEHRKLNLTPPAVLEPIQPAVRDEDKPTNTLIELKKVCKKLGINSGSMNQKEMIAAIYGKMNGEQSEDEAGSDAGSEGQAPRDGQVEASRDGETFG